MSFDGFQHGAVVDRSQSDFWFPSPTNTPFYPDEEKLMFNCEPNCIKDDVQTIYDMQNYTAGQLLALAQFKMRNEMEIKQQRELLFRMVMQNIEMRQLRNKLDFSRLRKNTTRVSKTLGSFCSNNLSHYVEPVNKRPREQAKKGGESWGSNSVRIANEAGQALNISRKLPISAEVDVTDALLTKYIENIEKMRSPVEKEKHELARDLWELYNFDESWDDFGIPYPDCFPETNSHATLSCDPHMDKTHQMNIELFKTEMCRSWTEFGICPYGNICRFAHGHGELRARPKPHKYKTEMCKKFLAGYCPYGSRCCFVHNPRERQRIIGRAAEDEKHPEHKRVSTRRWRPTPLQQRKRILQI